MSGKAILGESQQFVGTIGTILSANITVNASVSTINYVGTIGTILAGQVSATIESGVLQYVGTIGTILSANISVAVNAVSTIGTIVSGQVSATIESGQLSDVGTIGTLISGQVTATISSGQLSDVGTVGTIMSPVVASVSAIPQVTVGSVVGVLAYTSTLSATIDSSGGNVHGVVVTQEGTILGAAGTLVLFNYGAAAATATIVARVIGAASDTRGFIMGVRPLAYATLVASVMGTLSYSVFYE